MAGGVYRKRRASAAPAERVEASDPRGDSDQGEQGKASMKTAKNSTALSSDFAHRAAVLCVVLG
jgi:hypothetical protein